MNFITLIWFHQWKQAFNYWKHLIDPMLINHDHFVWINCDLDFNVSSYYISLHYSFGLNFNNLDKIPKHYQYFYVASKLMPSNSESNVNYYDHDLLDFYLIKFEDCCYIKEPCFEQWFYCCSCYLFELVISVDSNQRLVAVKQTDVIYFSNSSDCKGS
jgi:hypothetical protein